MVLLPELGDVMEVYLKIRIKGVNGSVEMEIGKDMFWDNRMGKDMLDKDKYNHCLDGVVKVYKAMEFKDEK